MLKAALNYRSKGLSVIPVGENKKPIFPWKKYTKTLPTKEQIKEWWSEYPDANLAIITGEISNLTVVDVEKDGETDGYPETLTCKTGGGGFHFYYQYSERFKNKVRVRELTDIRNDSGYVVAPPSIHQSGKRYKWFARNKIAPFPVKLFYKEAEKQAKTDEWEESLEGVSEGSRNETAAKVCGLFLTKTSYKLWERIAWPAVKEWNKQNDPPLSNKELRGVYDSIASRVTYHREDTEQEVLALVDVTKEHKEVMKRRRGGLESGVPSGFEQLDRKLNGGFKKGDFIVIGARPSVGKTALALTLAYNAALKDFKILFFSIEMSSIDVYDRILSFITKKRCSDIIQGKLKKELQTKAYRRANKLGISIVELAKATSSEVIEVTKQHLITSDVDMIIVDYLQFLRDDGRNKSEANRVGNISKNLKMLARMTNIPVIAPAQLNRKAEGRGHGNPKLQDLRDSGNIEADADVVFLLHRSLSMEHRENAFLDIAKNRKGETGAVRLRFNSRTTRFEINDQAP